jgi:hypothetical protein
MRREDYSIDENFQAALVEYEGRPFIHAALCRLYGVANKALALLIRRRSIGRVG